MFKSISGIRSIVTELEGRDELDESRVESLRACPVQFQVYVPGPISQALARYLAGEGR